MNPFIRLTSAHFKLLSYGGLKRISFKIIKNKQKFIFDFG